MITLMLNKSMKRYKKQRNSLTGFTLVEVLLCMAVLVGLLVGVMNIYLYCFGLQENSRNTSIALNEARAKLEEIRNTSFTSIVTNYHGKTFDLSSINGKIRTEATTVGGSGSLLDIRLVVCWKQKGGRIIGEGKIVSGQLVFYDLDGDGKIESPVELVTAIFQK